MGTNIWLFHIDDVALSAHRAAHGPIDTEDLFEVDIPGLTEMTATFRGGFFDDIQQRMSPQADTDWFHALAHGPGRLPAAMRHVPALADLAEQDWVVLTAEEFAELVTAARAALAADPDWSEDGSTFGPKWWYLTNEDTKQTGNLVGIIAL